MSDSTTNVPDVIRQEAKARALKIIESNKGCVSYVVAEDLETAALFIPVVTAIKPVPEDFYDPIPEVGIMMKPPLTNLICEKAGIEILRTETEKRGEYIWHAHVYGQKRQPDGTMLPKDASYEYDVEKRCELDFISDRKGKYTTEIEKRKHILKTAKFGDQRAVTGAQHALIHKFAKIPRSFKTPQELLRGMLVSRVDRNVNGIMQDPQMRQQVIDHALGVTETIYGPAKQIPRTVDVATGEMIPQPEAGEGELDFPGLETEAPAAPPEPELSQEDKLKEVLKGYKEKIHPKSKAKNGTFHEKIDELVANPKTTVEVLNAAIDFCEHYVQSKGGAA
jgi:hypothetical protein